MDMMTEDENRTNRPLSLLRLHRKSIVADLDVHDVLPDLLRHLIINHNDKQRVDSEKTLEDKANELINILEKKADNGEGKRAIPVFIAALKVKYKWLYDKLATEDVPDFKLPLPVRDKENNHNAFSTKKAKNMLEAGGVPCLPAFPVERKELLPKIMEELKVLKRSEYLVLQGMAGCGKSVLVTQCCRNISSFPDISKRYQDGIFWLSIGKECSEAKDSILAKMRLLCDKLEEHRAPNSLEHGAELLRTAFIKRTNTLLILDDVWRSEVIRAFDVGCRILVTTRDISVMDVVQGRQKSIKVSDGFTESEAMELFRQAVGIPNQEELPEAAHSIYSECKGSPMVVSLISALIKDHNSSDEGRWSYYSEALVKRRYSKVRRNREYEHESILDAIALSIEGLTENRRNLYGDFALFQDDVGIPVQVLMILWNLGKYEVQDIMKDFVRKSLAVDEYDSQRKCNVYSVHDLQLDYLKYQLQREEGAEKRLHSKLVDKYLIAAHSQFHKLPDDGYIHFYLGYHLHKSGRFEDFPRAYLNFLFIGEKIRITGPADLLIDLRKYQDYIMGDEFDERSSYIDELKTFTQLIGHRLYNQMDVDIVQLGLQSPNLREMYTCAIKLANSTPYRLYLTWKNAKGNEWKNPESTVLCSDNVCCVKFIGSEGSHFLAALNNGYIELCDLRSSTVCHLFSGHTGAVQSLDVFLWDSNPFIETGHSTFIFLSASEDKTCKLWNLKHVFEELQNKNTEIHPENSPSPKFRPDRWILEKPRDDSYLTFGFHTAPLTCAVFSRDGCRILSSSVNEIMIWNAKDGQMIIKISLPSSDVVSFQTCYFTYNENGDSLPCLLASAENQLILFSTENPTIFSSVEGHHMRIVTILQITSSTFCTVSENEIGLWRIAHGERETLSHSRSLSPRKSYALSVSDSGNSITREDTLTLSPDDKLTDGVVRPSDFKNPLNDATGRKSPTLSSDCYSPANVSTILSLGKKFIKLWREEVLPRKTTGLFQCAALSQDELLACGTSERKIVLWQLETRSFVGVFGSHNGWLRSLDFSVVDHLALLSGSDDHTVMVWDVEEELSFPREPLKKMLFSSVYIQTPELQNPGFFMSVFATDSNTLQVFRDSKKVMDSIALSVSVSAVTISACGNHAILGTIDGRILRLNNLKMNKKDGAENGSSTSNTFELIGSLEDSVTLLKFNSNASYLIATCASGNLHIYKDFRMHRKVKMNSGGIVNCHFIGNDNLAIISKNNNVITIQNTDTGNEFQTYKHDNFFGVTCSIKRVDSNVLVLGTVECGVLVYSIQDKYCDVETAILNCRRDTAVRSLALGSNGTKLAIGHDNGLITIWNLNGGVFTEEEDLVLHKSSVRFLLFSPVFVGEGHWLVSCGDRLAFWNLSKAEDKVRKLSFMEERRRTKSGDSRPPSRLSLDLSEGIKIGRQGKRELLQSFYFHGAFAERVVSNTAFTEFITVDDAGVLYLVETLKVINGQA